MSATRPLKRKTVHVHLPKTVEALGFIDFLGHGDGC
jgi:hypothetical protein